METDNGPSTTMEIDQTPSPIHLPLNMNCEDAVSFIESHLQSQNVNFNFDFSVLGSLSNSAFLGNLSELLLLPELTDSIAIAFFPILSDLVGRWTSLGQEYREQIACALGRLVHIEPKLKRHMQELILDEPSFLRTTAHLTPATPSETLLQQFSSIDANFLRELLLATWRLIIFAPPLFRPLIIPNPTLALLQHPDLSIRWLAIEILCIALGIAEAAKLKYMEDYIGGPEFVFNAMWENKFIDYGVMPLFDEDRLYNIQQIIKKRDYFHEPRIRELSTADLGPATGEICGVLIPRFLPLNPGLTSTLVLTENTKVNLREIASGIVAEKPLLLQSVPGAGKGFLIDEMAKLFGRYDDIVRITLTDQTDGKLLLGTYVTTTPGSFAWRPGILTTAVREGKWIVIEDIERAGNDVLSTLMPLLEGRPLELSGRGEVRMGKGGQIIATTTLFSGAKSAQLENMLGIERWTRITVIPPTDDDLLQIVSNLLPGIQFIAPNLLQVYTSLRQIYNQPGLKSSRNLSPRDLLKWTKRIAALCSNIQGQSIPRETWDDIFLEAIDCFAAMVPTPSGRRSIIERIGTEMGFPYERVCLYIESHSPALQDESHSLRVGRMTVPKKPGSTRRNPRLFAYTSHAKKLLEQLAVAVTHREPLLLVGETGTGKTTIVQHLADLLHHRLIVVNVSQQTESSDLLGGFKPVEPRTVAVGLKEMFEALFERTFSIKRNEAFLARIAKAYSQQKWKDFVRLLREANSKAEMRFQTSDEDGGTKKKRRVDGDLKDQWAKLVDQLHSFEMQLSSGKGKSHAFSFVDGSLVKALRRGDWLLLDEINLAAADTLESISGLIREGGSITLPEKGDLEAIKPHPDFRIFACMNPATDVGKRDLPPVLRGQLTELYVGSPDESIADLLLIVKQYIGHLSIGDERAASDVAQLYLKIKATAEDHDIVDGVGQKPHFSIRTLTRTLTYVVDTAAMYGLRRALYEGFCMSFSTMLEQESREKVLQMISEAIFPSARNVRSALRSLPKRPDGDYVQLGHYWIGKGSEPVQEDPQYIVKPGTSVEQNLQNLVRASLTRRYPILLQGPTSAGKTSMIQHLAKLTGHKFLRINNHEHTSLDEYLGTYISTPTGEFLFQEGILVQALRQGHWIVLDELNLAPSDVLEALNRLLDDNRELLIPETQEVIIPHQHFMLFATQNPAGLYGGRKVLSRAFRNRFLELEFDDIPEHELEEILCLRCQIPPSYGAKIVEVYKQLTMHRQSTRLFEQRNSFATLRDLFRWAQREAVGYQQLAENGYMLLAERVRKEEEKSVVKQILEKVMKVRIDENALYNMSKLGDVGANSNIIWTKAMRRLLILVSQALVNNEPILLVGETGCGKTTVCQILSERMGKELHIINAHQNTETGDIIGGQRPYRDRLLYQQRLISELRAFFSDRIETTDMELDDLVEEFGKLDVEQLLHSSSNSMALSADIERIRDTFGRQRVLFEWVDGALVEAMKRGEPFLLDEISLADDSVLERLNSVLEPGRSLVLAEKGGDEINVIAAGGFQFFATMNPGGDYGKKELSPALRNRFTEIWVPAVDDHDDLIQIVQGQLKIAQDVSEIIVAFAEWYSRRMNNENTAISIRDILAWVDFINATNLTLGTTLSLFHGAMMVYVDGIGTTSGTEFLDVQRERDICLTFLSAKLQCDFSEEYRSQVKCTINLDSFTLGHFSIRRNSALPITSTFSFRAPTTASNGMKVLRAMQLPKSILLDGAPGIGKTTLITAIAQVTGQPLTRINLSDQTDLMDLFGADVPVEGGKGGEFAWRDAPFLSAMQNGEWVLLDELNLASQSVLEGLNACLDHRGTAYIPELNRSFSRHPNFRIFAAQNPHAQGGGRKGLPKSFINRFSAVHLNPLTLEDMFTIGLHLYPEIDAELLRKLITYISTMQQQADAGTSFASLGKPWEFNLRDTMRWLELVRDQHGLSKGKSASEYLDLVITQRLRTEPDRRFARSMFEELVSTLPEHPSAMALGPEIFQAGISATQRNLLITKLHPSWNSPSVQQSSIMELLVMSVQHGWPCLLIGPSGSAKTASIRNLSSILGISLQEVSLNSDTDATDIIGGYEQQDASRHITEIAEEIRQQATAVLAQNRDSSEVSMYGSLINLMGDLRKANFDLKSLNVRLQQELRASNCFPSNLRVLIDDLQELLQAAMDTISTGKFRWYNGVLIDALLQGEWILLDNANLCNPSVLDRLNSLLEPNGCLVLHEFTNADGTPKIIKPHENFRLFLTMDPKYGELSRAMRNRTIEVSMTRSSEVQQLPPNRSLPNYLIMQSNFRGIQAQIDIIRSAMQDLDGYYDETICALLVEYIPVISSSFFKRWLVASSRQHRHRSIQQTILRNIEHLAVTPVMKDFVFYISKASSLIGMPASFATSQNLLPALNDYLPSSLVSDSEDIIYNISKLSFVYDICLKLNELAISLAGFEADAFLSDGESRGPVGKLKALPMKSLRSALSLSRGLAETVKSWVSKGMYRTLTGEELVSLYDLLTLCTQMSAMLKDPRIGPGYIQVFGNSFATWMKEFGGVQSFHFLNAIFSQIISLSGDLHLSTGVSMKLVWDAMRPHTPSSVEQWNTYEGLLKAFHDFEQKTQFQTENLDVILKLKLSLLEAAFSSLTMTQANAVPIELSLLDEMTGNSNSYLVKSNFPNAFAAMKTLVEVYCASGGTLSHSSNLFIRLNHLSGNSFPTYDLVTAQSPSPLSSMVWPLPAKEVLDHLSGASLVLETTTISKCGENISIRDWSPAENLLKNFAKLFSKLGGFPRLSILQLHADSRTIPSVVRERFKKLLTVLRNHEQYESEAINEAELCEYMYPLTQLKAAICAIQRSEKRTDDDLGVFLKIGHAFVHFALACLALYVPDQPFDPAAAPIVERRRKQMKETELREKVQVRGLIEAKLRGTGPSRRLHAELRELAAAQALASQTTSFQIYRPLKSQISQMYHELSQLLENTVKSSRVPRLLQRPNRPELETIIGNLERIATRLKTDYKHYTDLLSFIVTNVNRLIFGLKLSAEIEAVRQAQSSTTRIQHSCLSLSLMTSIAPVAEFLQFVPSSREPSLDIHLLERLCICRPSEDLSDIFPVVLSILDKIYMHWRVKKEKEKLDEAAKTSIYKRKDEEYQLEAAISEYFPDHYVDTNDGFQEREGVEPGRTPLLANLHRNILGLSGNSRIPNSSTEVLMKSLEIVTTFPAAMTGQDLLDVAYPPLVLSLASAGHITSDSTSPDYDFYRTSNLDETQELMNLLLEFERLTISFRESWPEQAVLTDILALCTRISELPNSTPLSRLLPHVERLYSLSDEWQKNASREYSLAGPHGRVRDMIVRWRGLELNCWKVLFRAEESRHLENTAQWWYYLYETLIYNCRSGHAISQEHMDKVLGSLNEFVVASGLGDFEQRLELLQSFAAHAEQEGDGNSVLQQVARGCYHVYHLYNQYSSLVHQALHDQKKPLEKELTETVQLASWRDTSVYALRESARKSHHRLFKTVRKYRDLLSQPVSSILRAGLSTELDPARLLAPTVPTITAMQSISLSRNSLPRSIEICQSIPDWSPRSQIFLEPLKLSTSMQSIFRRLNSLDIDLPIASQGFIEDIEGLGKQTPSVLTDENEKHVKFITVQKRRLLAQTLKTFRAWGINPKVNIRDSSLKSDADRMLTTPCVTERQAVDIENGIESAFYRIIDLLPRLRATAAEHSQDLSDIEFNRTLGYVESLVDNVFVQRQALFDFTQKFQSLKAKYTNSISLILTVPSPDAEAKWTVLPKANAFIRAISKYLAKTRSVIRICISILDAHKALDSECDISNAKAFCHQIEEEGALWVAKLDEAPHNDDVILTESTKIYTSVIHWFHQTVSVTVAMIEKSPALAYALKPITDVLADTGNLPTSLPMPAASNSVAVQPFLSSAEQLAISTLVSVQDISHIINDADVSHSFSQIRKFHAEVFNKLRLTSILNKIDTTFESSLPLLTDGAGTMHALAVFNILDPILRQYIHGVETARNHIARYHEQYSQMILVFLIYVYNLATKGFGTPHRKDKEGGSTTGEGVGLGEGTGEKDISNDIKDDEDLDDLAKQKGGESGEQPGESEQNGIDMDDDFEGTLEDAPDREEEDEEDGEEENEEMDEGVGDVDDTDPTAVDEQFWEDQANQPPESADEKKMQETKELEDKEGDLGASDKDRQREGKQEESKQEKEEGEGEDGDEMDEIDDNEIQNREDDSHVPEAQPLEIGEDFELDQEREDKDVSVFSDEDLDIRSQADEGEENEEMEKEGAENPLEEAQVGEDTDMQMDQQDELNHEEVKDDNEIKSANVDQSEYQGEEVVASEASGKGGDSTVSDEQRGGRQEDQSAEEPNESMEDQAMNEQSGADSRGIGQREDTAKESNDQSSEKEAARENQYKRLGDILEQWRRDLGKIRDVADEDAAEQTSVRDQNPEYSYVGEEQQFETQGLGPAAPEQIQPLDMSMAVDEDKPQRQAESKMEQSEEPESLHRQTVEVDDTLQPTSFGATIGTRPEDPSKMDLEPAPPSSTENHPLASSPSVSEEQTSVALSQPPTEAARQVWQQHDRATHDLSLSLCEQLRLILEPTLATKLRGDFRTGKRLNMRRIIPYIASDYKKDKIWMRRTKPSKRQYQVMIAMDDSKSMSDSKSVQLAFDTLALTAKALSQLEVGQISIVRFGEDVKIVHGFDEPFTSESGGKVVQQFLFDQARTDVCALTRSSIQMFNSARAQQDILSTSNAELWQLQLIISDGICEDHDTIRRLVREAFEAKIMMIFVILDAIHPERKDSILDIKSYSFVPGNDGPVVKETRYLDSFPFNYFVIVRDIRELPSVLASALRQWFAEVAER